MAMERVRRAAGVLSGAVLLVAPLSIATLIIRYGVNVPVEDQIDIGAFLVRNHARLFPSISDLFSQHNESRKVLPRLVMFYMAKLTHWNVKFEMLTSLVIACATVAALWVLARRFLPVERALPATALTALLVLSPAQWFNWLFGIQIVAFVPMLMLVVALAVAGSSQSIERRLLLAALCCFVANYSYANGMILWLLAGIALFANDRRPRFMAIWAVASVLSIGGYFVGYSRPAVSPQFVSPLTHPLSAAEFVLAFLGHPLAWTDAMTASAVIGAAGVLTVVVLAVRSRETALPWILIASYSLISAIATASGRLGFGEWAALEPRYTTFATGLWIAVVMLGAMQLTQFRVAAATLLIALEVLVTISAIPKIREAFRDRLVTRAAVQFCRVLPDTSLFRKLVYRDPQFAVRVLAELSRIGYINPPLVDSSTIQSSGTAQGEIEGVLRVGPRSFVIYGWTLLPDGVALITRNDTVVAISERTIGRADRPGPSWDLPLRRDLAIPGAVYNAYAYDTSTRRAYRLRGALSIAKR